jgi:DNA-binding XRE family transcriptional regulator
VSKDASQTDPLERRVVLLLRDERLKQDVSATSLAKKIGVSRATVTHIEADRTRPGFWVINRIAKGLGLDLADVIRKAGKK